MVMREFKMTENYDGKSSEELSIAPKSKDNCNIKPAITVMNWTNIEM